MAERSITVKFDGQAHQVDLGTFTHVLMNYSNVVRVAAQEAGIEESISVCISATEPGSLDVVLSVVSENAPGFLSFLNDNQGAAEALALAISTSVGLFKFKKWLADKKQVDLIEPSGEGEYKVEAGGDVTYVRNSVVNVYTNCPQATSAIDHAFLELDNNPAIEGFEMIDAGESVFRAERNEFAAIAASPNYEAEDIAHVEDEVSLVVVKPCLTPSRSRRWEFMYDGIKISATIADEAFLDGLHAYRFGVGTRMQVTLDITKEFDHRLGVYINKGYAIKKVHKVLEVELPETDPLF